MLLEKEIPDKLCSSLCSEDLFQRVPFPEKNICSFSQLMEKHKHIYREAMGVLDKEIFLQEE